MIDPISFGPSVTNAYAISPSSDNERAERVPDNETIELLAKAKAPLPAFQGAIIDVET